MHPEVTGNSFPPRIQNGHNLCGMEHASRELDNTTYAALRQVTTSAGWSMHPETLDRKRSATKRRVTTSAGWSMHPELPCRMSGMYGGRSQPLRDGACILSLTLHLRARPSALSQPLRDGACFLSTSLETCHNLYGVELASRSTDLGGATSAGWSMHPDACGRSVTSAGWSTHPDDVDLFTTRREQRRPCGSS